MVEKVIEKIANSFEKGRMSHAFLIETNNQEACLLSVLSIVKRINCPFEFKDNCSRCNICHLIDNKELPELYIIRPDGKNIKKEQIIDLKEKICYKPFISKNIVYVIIGAETLNSASTNSMLKFLEEPEDNVYGFLITNSKENVLPTIQSRCENEKLYYKQVDIFNSLNIDKTEKDTIMTLLNDYLLSIEKRNDMSIMCNKDILLNRYSEKKDIEGIFRIMFDIYNDCFLVAIGLKSNRKYDKFEYILNCPVDNIIKKIALIKDFLNEINYNVNIELLLDRFVVEMGEING